MRCLITSCKVKGRAKQKRSLCAKHNSQKWRKKHAARNLELNRAQYKKDRGKILKRNKTSARRKYKREYSKTRRVQLKKTDPAALSALVRKGHQTPSARFNSMKSQAKRRGIPCEITREQYFALRQQICYYCDGLLEKTGSGVDRIDNNVGYFPDNLVSCCGRCNRLKCHLLTASETKAVINLLKTLRGGSVWMPII